MKFTRRTYRKAIRRSVDRQATLFAGHPKPLWALAGWLKQIRHTDALRARRVRETGK